MAARRFLVTLGLRFITLHASKLNPILYTLSAIASTDRMRCDDGDAAAAAAANHTAASVVSSSADERDLRRAVKIDCAAVETR